MNRREFIKMLGFAGISIGGISYIPFCKGQANNRFSKPNIVLILADDMGYGDIQAYNTKSKIPTPNLNKLAHEGVRFTDAHTPSSVCTPTRYGLLTGRYCWRSRLKSGVLWDYAGTLIEKDRLTVAQMLKDEGYRSGIVGKWHLGIDRSLKNESEKHQMKTHQEYRHFENINFYQPFERNINYYGFDYSFAVAGSSNMNPLTFIENDHVTKIPTIPTPTSGPEKGLYGRGGHMAKGFKFESLLPTFTDKACKFVEQSIEQHPDNPFFLYFALTSPHTPIVPNKEFVGKSDAGAYGDFVSETDFCVGKLMKKLKLLGVDNNTLVIFASDNGPENDNVRCNETRGDKSKHGHVSQTPFRGWKRELEEGGHRVPFICRWHDRVKAGSTCETTICLTDFMPTVADIIGTKLPENAAEDGISFLPAILGKEEPGSYHNGIIHHHIRGLFAIRKGNYKLIVLGPDTPEKLLKKEPDMFFLYDVKNDVKEQNNLADKKPEIVRQLYELLKQHVQQSRST